MKSYKILILDPLHLSLITLQYLKWAMYINGHSKYFLILFLNIFCFLAQLHFQNKIFQKLRNISFIYTNSNLNTFTILSLAFIFCLFGYILKTRKCFLFSSSQKILNHLFFAWNFYVCLFPSFLHYFLFILFYLKVLSRCLSSLSSVMIIIFVI